MATQSALSPVIELGPMDLSLAKAKAKALTEKCRSNGLISKKIDTQVNEEDLSYIGILGEIAVYRALNLQYDFNRGIKTEDPGHDLTLPARTIQIRRTKYANGHLILNPWLKNTADITVLVTGPDTELKIVGYATRPDFAKAQTIDFGYGPVPAIPQDQLRPFSNIQGVFM